MPTRTPLRGLPCPDTKRVNTRIRRLMDQPASDSRTQEHRRLLEVWAEVTRADVARAA